MRCWCLVFLMLSGASSAWAQPSPPITYRVTFPAPEHHWLQVEVTFAEVGAEPLRVRMSRSSPGRYAVHEFAKNIFALEAFDGSGRALRPTRPDADEWRVSDHNGTVRLVYRIFGDHADGTYMGVDTTHAHLNMPATFVWGVGLEARPITVTFEPPPASRWKVATQLFSSSSPLTFTAPNLQYFMDSPTELADVVTTTFRVPNADGSSATFRIVAHTDAAQADLDELAKDVERLVREQEAVFGEFPSYEPGQYTFLLDSVAWAYDDGMEHRNSTSISIPGVSLRTSQGRRQALSLISHEFFHNWNVERIRPVGLEPFDFTRANITCCLWLAEGFTQYYGPLLLLRAGLGQRVPIESIPEVINGSGRRVRSAVEMSEQAPFADAGISNDMTDRGRTFISYYAFGSAIALGLDLSLRELSGGALSLDDYMRLLWQRYGRPADPRPGYVATPYSLANLRTALTDLTGNQRFANEFFDRFVEGREVVDYAHLLSLAGYVLQPAHPERGWIGEIELREDAGGLLVGPNPEGSRSLAAFGTPLYDAGVDEGDVITAVDGRPATMAIWNALGQKNPGDAVTLAVRRRDGQIVTVVARLKADPRLQIASIDATGGSLTAAQRSFRQAWLGTKAH